MGGGSGDGAATPFDAMQRCGGLLLFLRSFPRSLSFRFVRFNNERLWLPSKASSDGDSLVVQRACFFFALTKLLMLLLLLLLLSTTFAGKRDRPVPFFLNIRYVLEVNVVHQPVAA